MYRLFILFFLFSINSHANQLPLTIIIPNSPGGLLDIQARKIKISNRKVVIEYKPGVNGKIALEYMKRNPSNKIMLVTPNIIIDNDIDDFFSVAKLSKSFNAILMNRQNNNSLHSIESYGTVGSGSLQHIVFHKIFTHLKNTPLHVPYKGTSQIIGALLSNEINAANITLRSDLLMNEKIKIIALTSEKGQFGYKSLSEIGIPVVYYTWIGAITNDANETNSLNKIDDIFFDDYNEKSFLDSDLFKNFMIEDKRHYINYANKIR